MSNVVRLFDRDNIKTDLTEADKDTVAAEKNLSAACVELNNAVSALSKRFDKIEYAIASFNDVETKSRFKQANKLSREPHLMAVFQLSRLIGKLIEHRGA